MMRWLYPFLLCFCCWAFIVATWLHDWRSMVGSTVAFLAIMAVEEWDHVRA